MKNLKGGRCLIMLAFVLLGMFIALFGVSVIFNQQQPGAQKSLPTAQGINSLVPVSTTMPLDAAPDLGVTIQASDAAPASTQADTPMPTATQGQIGLGTPSFPLTLTAQHADDQTKVAGRLSDIAVTGTEISRQSQIIFATLTAAAVKK